jgi:hypothetical protein
MVKKVALKVCPEPKCPVVGSGNGENECPYHHRKMVRRVYEAQGLLADISELANDIRKAFST